MGKKIVSIIFIIIICPIILCGCWNYREIDTLAIVAGMALDKDTVTNKYILTTEVITTQAQGVSSIISSQIFTTEGDSVFSAVRDAIEKTGLRLFWSDSKVVIISDSIAREGITPAIDWTNRSNFVRPDMWLLVSKGNTASEILKTKVKINEVTSFHLDDTMNSWKILSKFTNSMVWSFIDELSSPGKSEAVTTVENKVSDGTILPLVEGCAIFKSDKLVGYIDGNETLYMLMIKNKIKQGLITLINVSGSNTNVTLELNDNRTKLTPIYNNGLVSMIIDVYPILSIHEIQGTKDFMKEENLETLQSEAEKKIGSQIQTLISKLQKDYDSDVLDFGEKFNEEKPIVSKDFMKNGKDIFKNMKTTVNVHVQIRGSNKTMKPIIIGQ
ncbi:Ger(x)C family spore germination protein [Clostridium estertheticum]|uniref:Ger(x)C family spore germination protein n=1 Tax=Clostridium estertheticum TaxID=238834 RepID=UPI001CF125D5|nr:Ger(x)C family spore germination protein [Clostridium estertheticum]MCB2305341.1 Ger(x)C family spore germination protein [Clostridium estertheticum]MCB2343779.1 Ger(x)C family spore germination protein [Clostridium estertheticum]MCB2348697.1 Ger(x)C family spore germination protein [Clostridium estertheticum]WAG46019.1 Ger(x)C family spore germination protein [Clostridium estertheticum]